MKKVCSLTALGFMLAIVFAAALPARADDVDRSEERRVGKECRL